MTDREPYSAEGAESDFKTPVRYKYLRGKHKARFIVLYYCCLIFDNITNPFLYTPPNEPRLFMRVLGYIHTTWWEVLSYTVGDNTVHAILSFNFNLVTLELEVPGTWELRNLGTHSRVYLQKVILYQKKLG